MAVYVVVQAYTYMLLSSGAVDGEYDGPMGSLFAAWRLSLLGDLEPNTYAASSAMLIVFYVSTILFNLIMTNAVRQLARHGCTSLPLATAVPALI